MNKKTRIPNPIVALTPLAVLVALLAMVIPTFGGDALLGGSQVSLLIASAVCVGIAMIKYNYKWSVLEEGMAKNIKKVTPAIVILLLIGAISGTWMLSGVVPTLIYYGLQILTPQFFLASCCIICAIVSIITGSSWTTIATIGMALLGIGKAQGFDEGWIAGAIISGAYFGDKISPLSDTTVLASSTTGTKLFTHIRYMLITTVPSIIITLGIFTVAGLVMSHSGNEQSELFAGTLAQTFNLSPWLLLVPVITACLILAKLPTIITLFISSVIAGICILLFQPHILLQKVDGQRGFGGELPAPVGVIRTVDENQVVDGGYEYVGAFTLVSGVAKFVCHGDVMLDALLFEIGGYCKFFVVHRLQGQPYLFFFHVCGCLSF